LSILLLLFALCHLVLLAWTFVDNDKHSAAIWVLRLLLCGVLWDNLVQGSGHWFIGGAGYEAVSYLRYLLHSAVLPLLVLFGLWVLGAAGVGVASSRLLRTSCWVFTLGAVAWGLYHDVYLMEFGAVSVMGVSKLVELSAAPPWATIASNLILVVMGAAVWRSAGWRWLFLGGLFILLVNGSTAGQPWGFVAANFAELVFILSLLFTERHFAGLPLEIKL
jgi:hypothetical protein